MYDALRVIWFILIGVLLLGYSILDGFDLGIGVLFPFLAKDEKEKRVLLNAIGPFWDGNEVWILTGGGALFAAFPHAYATVFSGFYLALMLVLFALIFRAVSFEFRAHSENKKVWEWAFVIGSFLPALLYGVALGNVVYGVPIKEIAGNLEYAGSFFTLLRPYPLVVGLFGLVMFTMQGAAYAALKSEGELQLRARQALMKAWWAFLALGVLTFVLTVVFLPHAIKRPLAWVAAAVTWVAWYLIKKAVEEGNDSKAFYLSSLVIAGLWGIVGAIHFPNLVRAINDPANLSLTIYNASSSQLTLTVMLIIALVGMPVVLFYTAYIYKWFKGKVKVEEGGY